MDIREDPLVVVVVSDNTETLDGLARYLTGVGITVRGTRVLAEASKLASHGRSAVVVFPDDYPKTKVTAALTTLKGRAIPTVLITSDLRNFDETTNVVLPKPAWGWTILDAIREHLRQD
jgi:DNA-binding response OmpR family regulator